jgi:uncharacterized protein with FMN-binding domain
MPRGLAALSASVVAAIYTAGYLRTQPVDLSLATSDPTAVSLVTSLPTAVAAQQPTPVVIARSVATATPSAAATSSAAQAAGFKDGTYSGQGTSRRGNVWVDVTIQNGRIGSVTITRSTLQYPVRDIAGLPAQAVSRQTAQVDIVSGATYSSQAFRAAVSQALSKATA